MNRDEPPVDEAGEAAEIVQDWIFEFLLAGLDATAEEKETVMNHLFKRLGAGSQRLADAVFEEAVAYRPPSSPFLL